MMRVIRSAVLMAVCVLALGQVTSAQTATPGSGADKDWKVTVYPVFAWVPLSIDIPVKIPPDGRDEGGSGEIIDPRFDGGFLGGVNASNGTWRIEAYALWAAFGGDRPDRPSLVVDVDLIFGEGKIGRRIAPDLYVTGGVRRLALDYDVTLGDLPRLSGNPGVWNPLVGIGWHRMGRRVEWHAAFDGGGFGVGTDVDLGASIRVDWKALRFFGLTAGYNFLYLKASDTVAGRDITLEPMLHGPVVGFGFYF
jgi:hypothetical protein